MMKSGENLNAPINLKDYLRVVPNWPEKGVNFIDITTVLENRKTYSETIDRMTQLVLDLGQDVDKIVAIDARGFIFSGAIADRLKIGLSLARKPGKLPYTTNSEDYKCEYATNTLTMNVDTIKPGEKVVIVDDLLASGGTAGAAARLVEKEGGEVIGMVFMVNLPFLHGSERLSQYNPRWLEEYYSE